VKPGFPHSFWISISFADSPKTDEDLETRTRSLKEDYAALPLETVGLNTHGSSNSFLMVASNLEECL
jgi:hypothetical protein